MVDTRQYPSCCGLYLAVWDGNNAYEVKGAIHDSDLDYVVIMHPKDLESLKKGLAHESIRTIYKSKDTLIILVEINYSDKDYDDDDNW